jgi:hypothetical protein
MSVGRGFAAENRRKPAMPPRPTPVPNTVYCTGCSARKRPDPGLLPALERYDSVRLREVARLAAADGARLLILSGRFGLLAAGAEIPWYDQRLLADEVPAMSTRVAAQLRDARVAVLVWFTVAPAVDPGVAPYGEVMRRAAAAAGVSLSERIVDDSGD